ncbi:MAG: PLP-dependent aminotransferase family protein [Nitrososphaerales archaeon]
MKDAFPPLDVQLELPPGVVDFRWGHPAASLLPAAEVARAADAALAKGGIAALSYGRVGGPASLIEPLTDWLARHDDPIPTGNRLFITAGISQGLDLVCTLFSKPGEVALVESPVYHLALKIFRDHGLVLAPVEADQDGMRPGALAGALAQVKAAGQRARFIYTVPTYNNPSSAIMPAGRRREVVALAEAAGATVLEDDVYRHLWFQAPPPPPMQAYGEPGSVIRLGSFSKILAPGLRLGWLLAPPAVVERCNDSGLLDSGGGLSHLASYIAGEFIGLGLLDAHVERLRQGYRARCEALVEALGEHIPRSVTWTRPGGGFFVWVTLPEGVESEELQGRAAEAGVAFVPGSRFCCCGGCESNVRLAFSLLDEAELREGAKRLAQALTFF